MNARVVDEEKEEAEEEEEEEGSLGYAQRYLPVQATDCIA
eukprot:SAG11_NODE_2463_length_3326_cov_18.481872_4_plen_40_part_00